MSIFVLALLSFSAGAHAQSQALGFALDRFDPAERGSDWFVLESLDLRGHLRPAVGLTLDYAYKPLVTYDAAGKEVSALVQNQLFAHLGASLVLWNRVRFGLNLPIAVFQNGNDSNIDNTIFAAPSRFGIGDLRLGGDVRILGEYGGVFTLAGGVQFFIPTGSRAAYTGDGYVRAIPRLLVAGQIGIFEYAAKLGVQLRALTTTFAGSPFGSEFQLGASGGVRLANKKLLIGPELYVTTGISDIRAFFSRRTTPFELLLGAHYTFARDFRVGAGIGPGMTRGYGSPQLRAVASIEWAPAPPEPKPDEPPRDRDGDGISDAVDACPDVPGVRTSDPKTNGCPPDRDGDGVYDKDDACPDVAGVRTNDPKTNGCPPDRDGDGIPDAVDACPDVAGVRTNDPKTNGCPPDRDGDGVYDKDDACPDTPGVKTDNPDTNGCPKMTVERHLNSILEKVKFQTGSATLLPESDAILSVVAKTLLEHPEIKVLDVHGHTDNVGTAVYNKGLSIRRANSVVKWLRAHGVPASRIQAAGFGLERPIDSNETVRGRANNRRVEFRIENGPEPDKGNQKGAPVGSDKSPKK